MDKESVENKNTVAAPAILPVIATTRTSFWDRVLYTYLTIALAVGTMWIVIHLCMWSWAGVNWFKDISNRVERLEYASYNSYDWRPIGKCNKDGTMPRGEFVCNSSK